MAYWHWGMQSLLQRLQSMSATYLHCTVHRPLKGCSHRSQWQPSALMPEQRCGKTEAGVVDFTGPQVGKEDTPPDKEGTAPEKAASLSMVSLVAAAETIGGFGPFPDTQVELPAGKDESAQPLMLIKHAHDRNRRVCAFQGVACMSFLCAWVQPATARGLWYWLTASLVPL